MYPDYTSRYPELGFYGLPGHTRTPRDILQQVQDAEALGIGNVMISERADYKEIADSAQRAGKGREQEEATNPGEADATMEEDESELRLVPDGTGINRAEAFLLSTLRVCTQRRYEDALEVLATRLQETAGVTLDGMDDANLDYR